MDPAVPRMWDAGFFLTMTMASGAPSPEEQDRLFRELFGVSKEELRAKGIDPGTYAGQNVIKAIDKADYKKLDGVISKSSQIDLESTRWGQRGYILLFVAGGLGILSTVHPLHVIALLLAFVACGAAAWVAVRFIRLRREYYAACKREGIQPIKIGLFQNYGKMRERAYENAAVKPTSPVTPPNQAIPTRRPQVETQARPPAWYADPALRYMQRYWDGMSWTAWVIDQSGAEITDPEGAPNLPAP